ncbi:3-dehydroquinate synthase [Thermosyntropha lipolytica DSM 11003]|uniref:3-dehydroquinate synthase n=1 Tax=Thermosyntropha lipolytica DSM 11003 TaxID=1123382 RepID=A0A1M5LPK3_9FIRM|nr:3-dehydroquinate synthase [Thermosyntropha lipolytica]SHG66820.1 3-dehydroquinate synthase [Thermosyntropha lipolytica DSM 11003]
MQNLRVELGERSYTISIEAGILGRTGEIISDLTPARQVLLVSNPTVFPLYGDKVISSLHKAGFEVEVALMPDGEVYKNMEEALKVLDKAVDFNLERTGIIAALGGGVVGDLAGLVAAVYQRGINFVQIPTTLLSQVDSSVGGKVAVNHPRGKNLIGAFHQPLAVIIDPLTLHTLSEREYKSGLGEVVKYGLIYDESFFAFLENNASAVKERRGEIIAELIYRSCRIKSMIVEKDEKEQGIRALLNLGHTFGHALEKITDYKAYSHGEAVAMGTVAASLLARERGYITEEVFKRILNLYRILDIYKEFPPFDPEVVYAAMLNDKKVMYGKMRLILPAGIGQAVIADDVEKEEIIRAIRRAQNLAID